jgi:hypothetical protein
MWPITFINIPITSLTKSFYQVVESDDSISSYIWACNENQNLSGDSIADSFIKEYSCGRPDLTGPDHLPTSDPGPRA